MKNRIYHRVMALLLALSALLIVGIQLVSCGDSTDKQTDSAPDTSEGSLPEGSEAGSDGGETSPPKPYDGPKVLTYENMGELSGGKNIVFFLVDRFDAKYYAQKLSKDSDFFDGLDGFTYFSDYTSLYCRTYPAVASILTGRDHDYFTKETKAKKFEKLYGNGGGSLGILKEHGYSINLYTEKNYVYTDASVLSPYADNVSMYEGDEEFMVNKDATASLKARLEEIELNTSKSYGQFTFIHLYGCHDTSISVQERINVTFDLIYYYIDQMKALGIYEDATIIITGDHAAALSDSKMIGSANSSDDGTRVTAMLFKRSGDAGTPLATSTSQVSQDELWNTIFESEGMLDEKRGESFFDIPEGEDRERRYYFEMYKNSKNNDLKYNRLYEYRITGTALDASNWEIVSEKDIKK